MVKQMIAFILLLAFATQTFSRAFIVFDYYINTKIFAKNCVNKARPKMHCNGKCQMMKKLKQEEKKDEQLPERKPGNKDEVLFSRSFILSIDLYPVDIKNTFFTKTAPAPVGKAFPVFHPPQV